ncbi:MAG: hypothetical protein NT175_13705 [Bacteroidetes bacterium]|nr:hypothetical protein [Bacteroidota bacterium]
MWYNKLSFTGMVLRHLAMAAVMMLISIAELTASDGYSGAGARSAALGNTTVCINDVWSIWNNPAMMVEIDYMTAGLFFENRFMMKELGYRCGALLVPAGQGAIGTCISNFGYSAFSEWNIGVSYARKFGPSFSTGVKLVYCSVIQGEDYGNRQAVTFGLGLKTVIDKKTTVAVHIYNPLSIKIFPGAAPEIATLFSLGLAYRPLNRMVMVLQADMDMSTRAAIKGGIEFRPVENFFLRAGICSSPRAATLGVGIQWKKLSIDLTTIIHQQLGIYPQASLQYRIR